MATTPNSALRYPAGTDAPAGSTQIQNLATDLDQKVIPHFASQSARNTAIPSPVQGQCCTVGTDLHTYDGSGWRFTRFGNITQSTDTNGLVTFSHGGGQTPLFWGVSVGAQATDSLNVISKAISYSQTSTTLTARWGRSDTSAYLASTLVAFYWWARF